MRRLTYLPYLPLNLKYSNLLPVDVSKILLYVWQTVYTCTLIICCIMQGLT